MNHIRARLSSTMKHAEQLVTLEASLLTNMNPVLLPVVVIAAYEARAAQSTELNERHLFLAAVRTDPRSLDPHGNVLKKLGRLRMPVSLGHRTPDDRSAAKGKLDVSDRARSLLVDSTRVADIVAALIHEPWVPRIT